MNSDHHSINSGGGQPPGNTEGQRSVQQQQTSSLPVPSSATDLRVNSAAVNVALSSVAKYWVFTNLFPSPLSQVSVYGIPAGTRIENGKPIQEQLGQASILNGDPNIILGHHGQTQVAVSAGGQQIPVSQIIATPAGSHEGLVTHAQISELAAQASGSQSSGNIGQSSLHQVPTTRVEFLQHNIDMVNHG